MQRKKNLNNPLKKLRKAKKESKKQWKKAKNNPTVEPETVKNLLKWRNQLMRLHNQMKNLEIADKKKSDFEISQGKFKKDPFKYAKKLFDKPNVKKNPTFDVHEANDFFTKTYADKDRDYKYSMTVELESKRPVSPIFKFETEFPPYPEFSKIVHKKKNSSAPGPSGISYLVWKKMPFFKKKLYTLSEKVHAEKNIPNTWQIGEQLLFNKTEVTSNPKLLGQLRYLIQMEKYFLL